MVRIRHAANAPAPLRSPAWLYSIGGHLLLVWLAMHIVWATKIVREKVFAVSIRLDPMLLTLEEPGAPTGGTTDGKALAPSDANDVGAPGEAPNEGGGEEITSAAEDGPPPAADGPPAPGPDPVIGVGSSRTGVPSAMQGRGGSGKGGLLRRYGGTDASERAVGEGLRWLVRHQDRSGRWRGRGWTAHCPEGDRCTWPAREEFTPGVTGLALLCFLGAGHTHRDGEFAEPVRRALRWLGTIQRPDGSFGGGSSAEMYNHAVCTFAITEAYAITGNLDLGRMAAKASAYLSATQQATGGWDYTPQPTGRSDMSIHGWAIAALRAARLAGIPLNPETWEAAKKVVQVLRTTDGRLTYSNKVIGADTPITPGAPDYLWESVSPVGLLCREYLDVGDAAERDRAAGRVMAGLHPPAERAADTAWMYFDSAAHAYYGTMALFHRGGLEWEIWNREMRERLVGSQCRGGHARGSWDPDEGWIRPEGGRMYATALAILTLEVYYRYLPLYLQAGSEEAGRPPVAFGRATEAELAAAAAELSGADPRADGLNADAVADLIADLEDPVDSPKRLDAARELASRGERSAVPVFVTLIPGLADISKPIYMELLARFKDPETIPLFAGLLASPSGRVRASALAILRTMSGKSAEKDVRAWLAARSGAR